MENGNFMNKPNFTTMNQEQLRQYIIANQNDKEAFYQYIDRLKANSHSEVYSASLSGQEIDKIISDRVRKYDK